MIKYRRYDEIGKMGYGMEFGKLERRISGNHGLVWGISVVGFCCLIGLYSGPLQAQSESRSLRVWVDTINLNLCGGRNFDTLGVWLESSSETDTVIGFRLQDSVLVVSLTLRWDTSKIRLEPPYILTPPQTLLGRLVDKKQYVDTVKGELWISSSTDLTLRPTVGLNIPLLYLKGRIRQTDTVITAPEAGARVQSIQFEGTLGDNLGTVRFLPGFVQVIRDTTPEYTGTLIVENGDLDTNQLDTIDIIVRNLSERRVRSLQLAIRAKGKDYRFVDTFQSGRMAEGNWKQKTVTVTDTNIDAYFESDSGSTIWDSEDSILFSVIVERLTDSAFREEITIENVEVNSQSCIGKIVSVQGEVRGEQIIKADTADTTDTTTSIIERNKGDNEVQVELIEDAQRLRLSIKTLDKEIVDIGLYNSGGKQVGFRETNAGPQEIILHFYHPLPAGKYYLIIQNSNGNISYKQFIQTQ